MIKNSFIIFSLWDPGHKCLWKRLDIFIGGKKLKYGNKFLYFSKSE